MKVLIIGGTGFLSSAIVREALERRHNITIMTRGSANRSAPPAGVDVVHADRSDAAAFQAAVAGREFDLVIDAILFKPDDAKVAVETFQGRINRYVFISTDFVYGAEPRSYPVPEETTPRQAASGYGVNKAAAEDVFFAAHADSGFPGVVLRPPHIMGAGSLIGTGSREGRDAWILYRLRNGHTIFLLDGGVLLIQPIHRDDIARACFAVAAGPDCPGRAYNTSGPDAVSTRRYYEIVCELIGLGADQLKVESLPSSAYLTAWPDRGSFAQNRIYSIERLRQDAGFVPTVRLRDSLAEMIAEQDAKGLPAGKPPSDDIELASLLRAQQQAIAKHLRPEMEAKP